MCELCTQSQEELARQQERLFREADRFSRLAAGLRKLAAGSMMPHSDEAGALGRDLVRLSIDTLKEWG